MEVELEDTDELLHFRQQWRYELGIAQTGSAADKSTTSGSGVGGDDIAPSVSAVGSEGGDSATIGGIGISKDEMDSVESGEAAELYWMGVAAERSGDMLNAIMYYRQAVQMVPDIESRVCNRQKGSESAKKCSAVDKLSAAIQSMTITGPVCQPEKPCTGAHVSFLPAEVVSYILRWVVSSDLNVQALERCSMVCHGFYVLARDPVLWRRICFGLWGECSLSMLGGSWRELFLQRPHLHFNGIYISKFSYVRQGEKSLDRYYKPYHTVVYYRYLRFFTDGSVMYQTSPDNPATVVAKLTRKHSSESVHLGKYTVQASQVSVDISSFYPNSPASSHQGRQPRSRPAGSHEFHMELQLKGKHFTKLKWQDHYCRSLHRSGGHVQVTHFTIDYKYTPFIYSRVRSYTTSSCRLLT